MALEQGANFEVENTRRATAASLELFGVWSLELGTATRRTGGCRAAWGTTLLRVPWPLRALRRPRGVRTHVRLAPIARLRRASRCGGPSVDVRNSRPGSWLAARGSVSRRGRGRATGAPQRLQETQGPEGWTPAWSPGAGDLASSLVTVSPQGLPPTGRLWILPKPNARGLVGWTHLAQRASRNPSEAGPVSSRRVRVRAGLLA